MKPKIQHENGVWYLALFPEEPDNEKYGNEMQISLAWHIYKEECAEAIANKLPVVNPEIIHKRCGAFWINGIEVEVGKWYDWIGEYEAEGLTGKAMAYKIYLGKIYAESLPDKEPVKPDVLKTVPGFAGHNEFHPDDVPANKKEEPVKDKESEFHWVEYGSQFQIESKSHVWGIAYGQEAADRIVNALNKSIPVKEMSDFKTSPVRTFKKMVKESEQVTDEYAWATLLECNEGLKAENSRLLEERKEIIEVCEAAYMVGAIQFAECVLDKSVKKRLEAVIQKYKNS